ncbi:biotin--[acetyl-CoA-carboxylase] ligase [candidate division WOR-3 bacterium]|jgi:BirA family biotin operon repressor/biotin-[acetyl-CoA-carboxylase] ligase|nr:biotin--[acetyl-CoA-carboxylase] ligase [candidate division WOR-3 bacterium]
MKNLIGLKTIHFKKIGSTNKIALSKQYINVPNGTVFIADEQTDGIGRKNRKWYSPDGGLYFTILFNEVEQLECYNRFSMLITLSVRNNLLNYLKDEFVKIKWPNDIYYRDKKICGILLQSITEGVKSRLAIGIGININSNINEFPEEMKPFVTSLSHIYGKTVDKKEFMYALLIDINHYYREFIEDRLDSYIDNINNCLYKKGQVAKFLINEENVNYKILGVNRDCSLSVMDERDNITEIIYGEVI